MVLTLPPMPKRTSPLLSSYAEALYQSDLDTWVDVCRRIIAKNPNVQPPPMPDRADFGDGLLSSYAEAQYQYTLRAWESIWD
jgi:hypothetical protein